MTLANFYPLFDNCGEVLTVKEAAQTIKCSEDYIIGLIRDDILPCFTIGSHYRVLKDDVIECLTELFDADRPASCGRPADIPPELAKLLGLDALSSCPRP